MDWVGHVLLFSGWYVAPAAFVGGGLAWLFLGRRNATVKRVSGWCCVVGAGGALAAGCYLAWWVNYRAQ